MVTEPGISPLRETLPGHGAGFERLCFQGVSVEVLVGAERTGGAWSLITYAAPAGFRGPLHRHRRTTEAYYVVEGRVRFRVGERESEMGVGQVIVVPPGVDHSFAVHSEAPARMVVHCSPGGMEGYFREVAALAARSPTWPPLDLGAVGPLSDEHDIAPAGG